MASVENPVQLDTFSAPLNRSFYVVLRPGKKVEFYRAGSAVRRTSVLEANLPTGDTTEKLSIWSIQTNDANAKQMDIYGASLHCGRLPIEPEAPFE